MNKVKKIAIGIIIMLIGIMLSSVSLAFEVYSDVISDTIKDHHFYPNTALPGGTFFCIEPGVEFGATLSASENTSYPAGSTLPKNGDYQCVECYPDLSAPWANGTKYFYRYTEDATFSWHEHSDVAYVLAQMTEEIDESTGENKLMSWDTAYGIWNSSISSPKREPPEGVHYGIIAESQAYKNFYEIIHGGATTNDIFETLIKNESNAKVNVNQKEGYYKVGPFKIDYPDGVYDGKNKFSWIESIVAATDLGEKAVTILVDNTKVEIDDLKENGTNTLDQKEFYVRIDDTEITDMKLKVKFGYLEHCDATMTKYTGTKIFRNWSKETSEETHDHPVEHDAEHDSEGNVTKEAWTEHHYKEKRRYKAQDVVASSKSQTLMALSGDAKKERKYVEKVYSISNPQSDNPPGDDHQGSLTMKLSGNVFLDKQSGKDNEINNKFNPENGEGLLGIEVYLHQVRGSSDKIIRRTHTNDKGYYVFKGLNAQYQYYVEFVYNGMLYTNVKMGDLVINANDISKSAENAHGHGEGENKLGNRQTFNNIFSQIGSYPTNYYSPSKGEKGDWNEVFLQKDIVTKFEEIASNYGKYDKNSNIEAFANDCRIHAYSEKNYPLVKIFTIDEDDNVIANEKYDAIYDEKTTKYNQKHINLGIKERPTFDLALYKDVYNATVDINRKQEVYKYDARKDFEGNGFSYSVYEDDYIDKDEDKTSYIHELRPEEIINGNNKEYSENNLLKDENLFTNSNPNNKYAWREIEHKLDKEDKLQIHVTYKIAIRNQSSIVGSATEIVDYYDSKYNVEKVYIGNSDGPEEEIPTWKTKEGEGEWQVQDDKKDKDKSHKYKTVYIQPPEQKLGDGETQYIYITFGLINPETTLIKAGLPSGEKLYTYNMAEINGYKTYGYKDKSIDFNKSEGILDKDSIPGNFNPSGYTYGNEIEDDTSRAPAYGYSIRESRTLEGNVFEDMLADDASAISYKEDDYKVIANETRFGDGTIKPTDKNIAGVKVELLEIKPIEIGKDENGKPIMETYLFSRQTTYTNEGGWYGFGAFLPGDYTIKFTYGSDDKTALTKDSQYISKDQYELGLNDTSYNGQDYQSTRFIMDKNKNEKETKSYKIDNNTQHSILKYKYKDKIYYWYADKSIENGSDAQDYAERREEVTNYSNEVYGVGITNHKAEVFNSYINQATLREKETNGEINQFTQAQPMDEKVDTIDKNRTLVNELESKTHMYAYTPEFPVEVEYTTKEKKGNLNQTKDKDDKEDKYAYKIKGIDFGVVERPRAQLTIDQDIDYIKVTASNGNTLLELEYDEAKKHYKIIVDNENNYQWVEKQEPDGTFEGYDKKELVNIIMDDELLSGSKLEVRYRFTVTNNSEEGIGNTKAVNIINYVANNLNFDENDNNGLWKAVKKEEIQTVDESTLINNSTVDLSTQTTILKATGNNQLTKELKPGESATETLTLKKILSAESSADDLSYTNMAEIVEIKNDVGRYDHGAIPGNQKLEEQPREHDTSGASRNDEMANLPYDPDGKIIITPPTGDTKIYYTLTVGVAMIILVGVILIKKFVLVGKKQ